MFAGDTVKVQKSDMQISRKDTYRILNSKSNFPANAAYTNSYTKDNSESSNKTKPRNKAEILTRKNIVGGSETSIVTGTVVVVDTTSKLSRTGNSQHNLLGDRTEMTIPSFEDTFVYFPVSDSQKPKHKQLLSKSGSSLSSKDISYTKNKQAVKPLMVNRTRVSRGKLFIGLFNLAQL